MYLTSEELQKMDIGQPLQTSQKSKNRLYLCWRNTKGNQCKMIGPQTKCFCNHKFKDHEYLNPKGKKAPCSAPKCKCKSFDYIPSHGAYDFKCLCKHSFKQHDCEKKKCMRENCKQCNGFESAWTCSCGSKFIQHSTIVETYLERKQNGKTVNDMCRLSEQLNHLTQDGSLLRPIKMDPQERLKQKEFSNPFMSKKAASSYERVQQEQLEQYRIDKKYK